MASARAHQLMGYPCAVAAAALVYDYGLGHALLAALAGYLGSMAPDRLEEKWWAPKFKRFLAHRGWTHIVALWCAGLYAGWWWMWHLWGAALFGFAIGGLAHLISDLPNKPGVPLLWPKGRVSLRLWKSGTADSLLMLIAWAFALWVADWQLLDGTGLAWAKVAWGWVLA